MYEYRTQNYDQEIHEEYIDYESKICIFKVFL